MPAAPSSIQPADRKALGAIWLTVFIDLVGFSIIFPLFPAMLEWYLPREGQASALGWLIATLQAWTPAAHRDFLVAVLFGGVLGSLYSLLQFAAAPVWGRLSDRFGRRNILLLTTSGTALAYLLWVFSGSFTLLVLSRLLGGCMAGNLAVATAAIADVTARSNRSKGMALIGVAFGLGFICGPAIGGSAALIDLSNADSTRAFALNPFSFPALCAFALALLNCLWVWRAFPETRTASAPAARQPFRLGSAIPEVQRALRVYFVFLIAFAGMEFTLTFLALERLAYSPTQMIRVFLFVGITLAVTQGWFVRKYARRIGEHRMVVGGLLAGSCGLALLAIAQASLPFYLGLACLGIGIGTASPALTAMVSLFAPADQQGAELGAFRSTGSLARACGPLLAALLFWALGSTTAYFIGTALLAAAAILALRSLPKAPV